MSSESVDLIPHPTVIASTESTTVPESSLKAVLSQCGPHWFYDYVMSTEIIPDFKIHHHEEAWIRVHPRPKQVSHLVSSDRPIIIPTIPQCYQPYGSLDSSHGAFITINRSNGRPFIILLFLLLLVPAIGCHYFIQYRMSPFNEQPRLDEEKKDVAEEKGRNKPNSLQVVIHCFPVESKARFYRPAPLLLIPQQPIPDNEEGLPKLGEHHYGSLIAPLSTDQLRDMRQFQARFHSDHWDLSSKQVNGLIITQFVPRPPHIHLHTTTLSYPCD